MDFTKQFKSALRVSAPLLAVRTFDAKSTRTVIDKALTSGLGEDAENIPVVIWDAVHGMRAVNKPGETAIAEAKQASGVQNTEVALEALRLAEYFPADTKVFFCNAHLVWTADGMIQGIWNLRDVYKGNGSMLILLVSPGAVVPTELVNDVLIMDEPLPSPEDLQSIICDTFESAKHAAPKSDVLQAATDALIGLPAFPAEQSTAMCLDHKTGKLDVPALWTRKRQIISQTPGCSVIESTDTLKDVRGLDAVVTFLRARLEGKNPPKAILFQDEVEKQFSGTGTDMSGVITQLVGTYCTWFDPDVIEGITFVGLPGVSKSALARAFANHYHKPLIGYDIAAMQHGIVGSSGENLRAAQKMVDAISERKLLVISTSNGIDSLPPEVRRRVGSLGIFFFDAPTANERADIWKLYRERFSISADQSTPADKGWTGAEIKECCRKADVLGMTLEDASRYVVPVTRSNAERIKALRMSCSGKYLSASNPGLYEYHETEMESPSIPVVPAVSGLRKMRDVQ